MIFWFLRVLLEHFCGARMAQGPLEKVLAVLSIVEAFAEAVIIVVIVHWAMFTYTDK